MPAGRPPKYETPKEMQSIIDVYFLSCAANRDDTKLPANLSDEDRTVAVDIDDVVPTISGLAYTLGMSTESFRRYGLESDTKDSEFSATVKRAKQRVEMSLEQRLAGNSVTGSIFSLKNNFGWKDKTEQEISGGLEVTKIERTIVKAKD